MATSHQVVRLRRRTLVGAAVAGMLAVAGCGGDDDTGATTEPTGTEPTEAEEPTSAEPVAIRSTVGPSVPMASVHIALAKGFFEEQGVEIEKFPQTPTSQTVQLLSGGELDIAMASPGAALNNAILGGSDLVVLAAAAVVPTDVANANSGLLVSDRLWQEGVQSVEDLAGETVHVTPTLQSASGMMTITLLQEAGLSQDDVTFQDWTEGPKLTQAFQNGAADAIWVLEPSLSVLQEQNDAHVLGTGSEVAPGLTALAIVANRDWAEQNADAVANYLRAFLQGARYFNEGVRSDWQTNSDGLDIVAEAVGAERAVLESIKFPEFPDDGIVDLEQLDGIMAFLSDTGAVETVVDPREYVEDSYLTQALEQ